MRKKNAVRFLVGYYKRNLILSPFEKHIGLLVPQSKSNISKCLLFRHTKGWNGNDKY